VKGGFLFFYQGKNRTERFVYIGSRIEKEVENVFKGIVENVFKGIRM